MDESQRIVQFTHELLSNAEKFDDFIDKFLAPYTDYIETIEDVATPFKSVVAIISTAKRINFKKFLKSYALKINKKVTVNEDFIRRLEKYLKNENNLQFIADTIDASISSKSTKCAAILGAYAGDILADTKKLHYQDTLVINALRIMIDEDLTNFIQLFEKFSLKDPHGSYRIIADAKGNISHEFQELGVNPLNLILTVEKLKNSLVLGYDIGGYGGSGNAWSAFEFNENTEYFYKVIVATGIIHEKSSI